MSAHRLPIYGMPTRFGRSRAGFFKQVLPATPPPEEGMIVVSRWPLDDTSWADTVGSSPMSSEYGTVTLASGYQGSAAQFEEYSNLVASTRSCNLTSWEISMYFYFGDFDSIVNNGITRIASYGDPSNFVEEWHVSAEPFYDGSTLLGYTANFYIGFNFIQSPLISPATWHLIRFGLEVRQEPLLDRMYLSFDGGVESNVFESSDPPVATEPTAILCLGSYNYSPTANNMRIDEVELTLYVD